MPSDSDVQALLRQQLPAMTSVYVQALPSARRRLTPNAEALIVFTLPSGAATSNIAIYGGAAALSDAGLALVSLPVVNRSAGEQRFHRDSSALSA